jgi:hypothetical protein
VDRVRQGALVGPGDRAVPAGGRDQALVAVVAEDLVVLGVTSVEEEVVVGGAEVVHRANHVLRDSVVGQVVVHVGHQKWRAVGSSSVLGKSSPSHVEPCLRMRLKWRLSSSWKTRGCSPLQK